jgi:hypothetical protein
MHNKNATHVYYQAQEYTNGSILLKIGVTGLPFQRREEISKEIDKYSEKYNLTIIIINPKMMMMNDTTMMIIIMILFLSLWNHRNKMQSTSGRTIYTINNEI